MKRAALAIATVTLAMCLVGCSPPQSTEADGQPAKKDQQALNGQASVTPTPKDKLSNLKIGETAVFDKYSVTVSSVDTSGDGVVAHVKIAAHGSDQKLKAKYLKGGGQSGSSFPDGLINVPANSEVEGTISYSVPLKKLKWDNWGNEATWTFDNASADAASAEEDALMRARQAAEENAKKYFDVPNSVSFSLTRSEQKRTGDLITEQGKVKFKNAYGAKIEQDYWLVYDDSGALTRFKVGDDVILG